MNRIPLADVVKWLQAAGEPSRLRLLALCTEGALSVSDLAQALRQSEPRVSRHLKILSEGGLIVRMRQGQWVHYRVADQAEAASFVRGLLAQLDRSDPVLLRDRTGARAAAAPRIERAAHGAESRLGRAMAIRCASEKPSRRCWSTAPRARKRSRERSSGRGACSLRADGSGCSSAMSRSRARASVS